MGIESPSADMARLLSDMRAIRSKAMQDNVIPSGAADDVSTQGSLMQIKGEGSAVPDFSKMLEQAINKVNDVQQQSGSLKKAYELGDPQVDITQVMVASQKASVAFEAMKQVRNKLLEAYKDVMNMPI